MCCSVYDYRRKRKRRDLQEEQKERRKGKQNEYSIKARMREISSNDSTR